MKIRIGFNLSQNTKNKIEKFAQSERRQLQESLANTFGVTAQLSREGKLDVPSKFLSSGGSRNSLVTQFSDGPSSLNQQIATKFVKAWENRYKQIQERQRQNTDNPPTQWQLWKENNMGGPAPHWDANIQYSTFSLATGYLRQSVKNAFKQGSNRHLDLGNLMVEAGWHFRYSSYSRKDGSGSYVAFFRDFLREIGAIGDSEEIIEFDRDFWIQVSVVMRKAIENNFIDPMINFYNNIDIEL